MRIHLLFPVLTSAALVWLGVSAGAAQAGGSFFGPSCYGANYTYQYPNRSHNLFGCGPGTHCRAWHPFCKRRRFDRYQCGPNNGVPVNGMAGCATPINSMPVANMPLENLPAPVTSPEIKTALVPATPAVRSRVRMPNPLPMGSISPEPPLADQSGKAPF